LLVIFRVEVTLVIIGDAMKTLTITAAIIATLAVPSMLPAADEISTTGSVVCRAAGPNDISNATLGGTALVCRKIDMKHIKTAIAKLQSMEDRMDQATRHQVDALEKMITEDSYYD
jgi:hypothetical protein